MKKGSRVIIRGVWAVRTEECETTGYQSIRLIFSTKEEMDTALALLRPMIAGQKPLDVGMPPGWEDRAAAAFTP